MSFRKRNIAWSILWYRVSKKGSLSFYIIFWLWIWKMWFHNHRMYLYYKTFDKCHSEQENHLLCLLHEYSIMLNGIYLPLSAFKKESLKSHLINYLVVKRCTFFFLIGMLKYEIIYCGGIQNEVMHFYQSMSSPFVAHAFNRISYNLGGIWLV